MQAAACRDGVDQGLQLFAGAPWTILATSAATRYGGKARRVSRAVRAARTTPTAVRPHAGPLSGTGPGLRCHVAVPRRVIGEPGGPAEAERAVDQALVAADRDIGADLEVRPAQLVFDPRVA